MANARDESRTGTTDTTTGTPQVQVFDNNRPGEMRTTSSTNTPAYGSTQTDLTTAPSTTNWGTIILALLIIAAVIALLWWLL